ncbi:MAG TPA: lipoprotein-releasing ABC transporter permease subunit [Steroidobacteraceae bacterium]|nr:lipoprotein-releasing ABC transporter permease subunit [Steroidobacteraceae bacterium]
MAFWYEGFLGWRYLRASPRRGFVSMIGAIAMLGLCLGVAVLIVVLSVMNGFEQVLRTRILSLTAHATISGLEGRITHWRHDLGVVAKLPGIAGAAPYIEQQGMLIRHGKSAGILIEGIDPRSEGRVASLGDHLLSGHLRDLTPGRYRIILGKDLAAALGAKPGDRVVMIVAQGDVTPVGIIPRMRAFRVAGILSIGMYDFDRRVALVSIDDAAKLLQMGPAVTGIRLRMDDMYQAPTLVRRAALALGGGFYVDDWTGQHANFFRSIQITKHIMFVILSLVVAVAAFNVVSTMVMVVKDKRRDIAILRTLGASPSSILSVFMVQGSLIGVLGIAAGVALGVLISANLAALVRGLEGLTGIQFLNARVYYMSELPARVLPGDVLRICAIAFALACVSTLYPAWRAARLAPADSLRND